MSSNPARAEPGVHSTSVLRRTWTKKSYHLKVYFFCGTLLVADVVHGYGASYCLVRETAPRSGFDYHHHMWKCLANFSLHVASVHPVVIGWMKNVNCGCKSAVVFLKELRLDEWVSILRSNCKVVSKESSHMITSIFTHYIGIWCISKLFKSWLQSSLLISQITIHHMWTN